MSGIDGKKYESVGTIGTIKIESGEVIFIPDRDHCTEHDEDKFATFVSSGSETTCCQVIGKKFQGNDNGVMLLMKALQELNESIKKTDCKVQEFFTLSAAQTAAITQSRVKVEVEVEGSNINLTGISVPSK